MTSPPRRNTLRTRSAPGRGRGAWVRRRNSGRRAARTAGGSPAVRVACRSCARQVAPAIHREGLGLRGKVRQDEIYELGSRPGLECRVETTLEADGRAGLPAQPFAARRTAEMRGKDLEVIGQRHDLAVQALVELLGEPRFGACANEVWATDPAGEERIAGQDEPWLRGPRLVRDQDRDTVGGVPRRVEDREHHVAKLVAVPVLNIEVGELDRC